ncbi:MAG: hypothetical protein ABSC94_23435 [Polyangiaceae bacterium]
MVPLTVFLLTPSLAFADDAGDSETSGDASPVDSDGGDGAPASGESEASAPIFIACDGDLCDTLQGRPTCAVAERSIGHAPMGPTWLIASAAALAVCMKRRARRGASCPIGLHPSAIRCPASLARDETGAWDHSTISLS